MLRVEVEAQEAVAAGVTCSTLLSAARSLPLKFKR
jgi:hypothetical protein